MALLCSCKYDDPQRDALLGTQTQLLGKWEALEVSDTSNGKVVWVLGRGFEFLPDGQLTLHIYWNHNWKAVGSTEKDYRKISGRYSLAAHIISVSANGEEATAQFPSTNEVLKLQFRNAENPTPLRKVSKFKFE